MSTHVTLLNVVVFYWTENRREFSAHNFALFFLQINYPHYWFIYQKYHCVNIFEHQSSSWQSCGNNEIFGVMSTTFFLFCPYRPALTSSVYCLVWWWQTRGCKQSLAYVGSLPNWNLPRNGLTQMFWEKVVWMTKATGELWLALLSFWTTREVCRT